MKRKHLITIGVIIAIVLLLYWLFIAEDLNAWLNVIDFSVLSCEVVRINNVSSQKIKDSWKD